MKIVARTFEQFMKQVKVTLQGMAEHMLSIVFNYQLLTLLWYLCHPCHFYSTEFCNQLALEVFQILKAHKELK